jgi:hypothetical protein
MSSFDKTIQKEVFSFASRLGPLIFALVGTMFSWGLIDSARRSIFQPWLLSKLPIDDTQIEVKNGIIDLGDFYAAAIVWGIVMVCLVASWFIYTAVRRTRA